MILSVATESPCKGLELAGSGLQTSQARTKLQNDFKTNTQHQRNAYYELFSEYTKFLK